MEQLRWQCAAPGCQRFYPPTEKGFQQIYGHGVRVHKKEDRGYHLVGAETGEVFAESLDEAREKNLLVEEPTEETSPKKTPDEEGTIYTTPHQEEVKPVPGEYEKFLAITQSLSLKEDFAKAVADYMFAGNMQDLTYVWDALSGMALRPDVSRRIFNMWSHVINQPIPEGIAAQVKPQGTELAGGATKAPARQHLFTVVDDKMIADPEGDLTFSEARIMLAENAARKVAPDVGKDKLSDIIGAITPFIERREGAAKEAEEKKVESSLVVAAIDALKERGGNVQAQQPLTLADLLTLLGKFNEMRQAAIPPAGGAPPPQRSMLDELTQLGSTLKVLQEVFGGGGGKSEGQAPVYITLPGTDGQGGGIPLDSFMKWDEHRWNRHKDEQKFQDSRENAKVARDFLGKLGKAAARLTPKEE